MPNRHCPTREEIAAYIADVAGGGLDPEFDTHIDQCDTCLQVLDTLISDDPILVAVRHPAVNVVDPDRVNRLIDRIHSQVFHGPDTTALEIPKNGQQLGKYKVISQIGNGGMGTVLLAQDVELQRRVALKLIKPERFTLTSKQRFLREARAAASLDSDHIVTIFDAGEFAGMPYISMPVLCGESLRERLLKQSALSQLDALRVAMGICRGLEAAHAAGIVHRDIKPGNIWLEEPTDRAKILDFGVARNIAEDSGLTQSDTIVGTPCYMAPEQIDEGRSIDHRCDLFSLGVVLYEVLSGISPFKRGSVPATLHAVSTAKYKPIGAVCSGLLPELGTLIAQLLKTDPDHRPQTAAEVSRQLGRMVQKLEQQEARRLEQFIDATTIIPGPADISGREPKADCVLATESERDHHPPDRKPGLVRWVPLAILPIAIVGLASLITIDTQKRTVTIDSGQHAQGKVEVTFIPQAAGQQEYRIRVEQDASDTEPDQPSVIDDAPANSITNQMIGGPWLRIDDGDEGYDETSAAGFPGWQSTTSATLRDAAFQRDYRYNERGAQKARWTFTGLVNGTYEVFVTWVPDERRAIETVYGIDYGADERVYTAVNQRVAPQDLVADGYSWERIGIVDVKTATLTIELDATQSKGGGVAADAVQIRNRPNQKEDK